MAVKTWTGLVVGVIAAGCAANDGMMRIGNETHLQVRSGDGRKALIAPPVTTPVFDARTFANDKVTPGGCNAAALELKRADPDKGWAALRACVKKGRFPRGDFTDLRLLTPEWQQELATRPEAASVVARVVALRGGDVDGDLARLQQHRIPVFTLAAAMKSPTVYAGRYVLVRASVEKLEVQGGKPVLRLAERTLQGVRTESEIEGPSATYSTHRSGRTTADAKTSRYGDGSLNVSYASSTSSRVARTEVRYENASTETGRHVLGRLPAADPFLEHGKEYIVLGRFDGTRRSADVPEDAPDDVAVFTVVAYHPPGAMLID